MKNRTKALMDGMIIVDVKKLEKNIAIISCSLLFLANKLLTTASVLFGIITVICAGDGKYSDGNIQLAVMNTSLCIICGLSAKLASMSISFIVKKTKSRK